MSKVIMVVVDGLRYDTAVREMGFLEASVVEGLARRWKMRCALPSLSRPLYETLHTGVAPVVHGVVSNQTVRRSTSANIFDIAKDAGKTTAAAAYSWFAELYVKCPYDPIMDREMDEDSLAIQHGRYYTQDPTPDLELMQTGAMLVARHQPDYCLIHPMGCDNAGHVYGGETDEYDTKAAEMDNILSLMVPGWVAQGYHVLVTSDHGMDAKGSHGGSREEVTAVPYYHFGAKLGGIASEEASQLSVAPTILALLELEAGPAMTAPVLI